MTLTSKFCTVLLASTCTLAICLAETNLDELAKAPPGKKFNYGPDALQFGELTMPEGAGPFPVVINIHGGCWLAQYNIDHSRALANALAKEGIAVWNIEYRKVGDSGGGWHGTFLDVGSGADYLRTLAKDHPLDLSRVVAMGHSAGGQFALWLAMRNKIPESSEIHQANPIPIIGVLGLAPASELDALQTKKVCGGVVEKLMGGSPVEVPDRYKAAMPSANVPIGVRQILIVGKRDKDWGWVGQAYRDKAIAAKEPKLEFIEAPDSGHFEVIDPGSTTWPMVRETARDLLGMK